MSQLANITILMGVVLMPFYALMVVAPGVALRRVRRFPRSRIMGVLLSVVVFAWCGWLLSRTPLGRFESYRMILYLLLPVICLLVNLLNEELLAPRALGGIMVLVPAPILAAARWHPSPWRYLVLVTAYILVIKGIMLLLSPYLFRKTAERIIRNKALCRAWGGLGMAVALLFVILGITVFHQPL